jgi:two-component system copper resistance phosphate regulon response regulator CusR
MLAVADLKIDRARFRVTRAGIPVALGTVEFAILAFLARDPGRTFTRGQIVAHVWPEQAPKTDNIVDTHIRRLRAKIDDHFPVKLIQTVRGAGYRLAA